MLEFFRHKEPFPLSKLSIILGLFIIISASFMRQLMDYVRYYIGNSGVNVLLGFIIGAAALTFLIFIIKTSPDQITTLVIIILLTIGFFLVWQIKIPEERIHILEYSILGWLVSRDIIGKNKTISNIIYVLLFIVMIGILDEGFQRILPYRYFECRDILLNSFGGIWGINLYLLYKRR